MNTMALVNTKWQMTYVTVNCHLKVISVSAKQSLADYPKINIYYDEKSLAPSIYHGNPKVPDNG